MKILNREEEIRKLARAIFIQREPEFNVDLIVSDLEDCISSAIIFVDEYSRVNRKVETRLGIVKSGTLPPKGEDLL